MGASAEAGQGQGRQRQRGGAGAGVGEGLGESQGNACCRRSAWRASGLLVSMVPVVAAATPTLGPASATNLQGVSRPCWSAPSTPVAWRPPTASSSSPRRSSNGSLMGRAAPPLLLSPGAAPSRPRRDQRPDPRYCLPLSPHGRKRARRSRRGRGGLGDLHDDLRLRLQRRNRRLRRLGHRRRRQSSYPGRLPSRTSWASLRLKESLGEFEGQPGGPLFSDGDLRDLHGCPRG